MKDITSQNKHKFYDIELPDNFWDFVEDNYEKHNTCDNILKINELEDYMDDYYCGDRPGSMKWIEEIYGTDIEYIQTELMRLKVNIYYEATIDRIKEEKRFGRFVDTKLPEDFLDFIENNLDGYYFNQQVLERDRLLQYIHDKPRNTLKKLLKNEVENIYGNDEEIIKVMIKNINIDLYYKAIMDKIKKDKKK